MLGELAGKVAPSPLAGGVDEFVKALPDGVACSAAIWSQHMYTDLRASRPRGAVGQMERALDARPCTKGKPVWVTETGVGADHAGRTRAPGGQLREGASAGGALRANGLRVAAPTPWAQHAHIVRPRGAGRQARWASAYRRESR